jgi:hypothetical protein
MQDMAFLAPRTWTLMSGKRKCFLVCPGAGKGRLYSAEEIEDILLKKKDVDST